MYRLTVCCVASHSMHGNPCVGMMLGDYDPRKHSALLMILYCELSVGMRRVLTNELDGLPHHRTSIEYDSLMYAHEV
jgi:hypothetical protein